MSADKEAAKKRIEMLSALRQEHQDSIQRAQAMLKEQQAVRKQLRQAMQGAPHTVPELAQATGLPADQVFWHVSAMKKYDLVVETGMDDAGEYYLYRLAQEAKS
jgi:predicted Rossmann fold nucleotide-binding protein DprA/Smf involved in DNA uptake